MGFWEVGKPLDEGQSCRIYAYITSRPLPVTILKPPMPMLAKVLVP